MLISSRCGESRARIIRYGGRNHLRIKQPGNYNETQDRHDDEYIRPKQLHKWLSFQTINLLWEFYEELRGVMPLKAINLLDIYGMI